MTAALATSVMALLVTMVAATSALCVWKWALEERKKDVVEKRPVAAAHEKTPIIVSGVSVGLPGSVDAFASSNWESLCSGECRIQPISERGVRALLARKVVQMVKEGDQIRKIPVRSPEQTISVSGRLGKVDLEKYGVPKPLSKTMGKACQVAVAAGFEALLDAGLLDDAFKLREDTRDSTGVIYATSFPALDAALAEASRFAESMRAERASSETLLAVLEEKMGCSKEIEELRRRLAGGPEDTSAGEASAAAAEYSFDRKFLFKVLVLANAQLAQCVGARGPNLQTNAACAGTTQAIALATDLIRMGRCDRVVVVSGDDASGDSLMPWLGNGFNALGAATTAPDVKSAVHPFDQRRSGMIVGAGACGIVVERRSEVRARCRVIDAHFSNSAFHGAAMDRVHIAAEFEKFISRIEKEHGILREEIAKHGIYLSHETGTHATPSSSCAANEIYGLKIVFGDCLKHMRIVNTKAITGHPMAVGIEDALAAYALSTPSCRIPPFPIDTVADPNLVSGGTTLKLFDDIKNSQQGEGRRDLRYALRFAAGFGSQVALALYASPTI